MSKYENPSYPGLCWDRGADDKVMGFIRDFLSHEGDENWETIRHLFHAGYCYYFAEMLRSAFCRGQVCLAYPYGHIVWLDGNDETSDIAYDIEGVRLEYDHLIPVRYLGETVQDFKHIPGECRFADKVECEAIYQRYISDMKKRCLDMNDKIFNTKNLSVSVLPNVTLDMVGEKDILMRLRRDPMNRSDQNITYLMERELLEASGIKEFVHKTFSVHWGASNVLVFFTPAEMVVATNPCA